MRDFICKNLNEISAIAPTLTLPFPFPISQLLCSVFEGNHNIVRAFTHGLRSAMWDLRNDDGVG